MTAKAIVFILFILVLISLARGLFFLVKDKSQSKRTVNSLTYRVIFSMALLLFLLLSAWQGWIDPHTLSGKPQSDSPVLPAEPQG